jgi:hypothetical protein
MEQGPSWEANSLSVSKEIPHLVWYPKVHYNVHKIPQHQPLTNSMEQSRPWETNSRSVTEEIPRLLRDSTGQEGSLPCSQEPTISPCP